MKRNTKQKESIRNELNRIKTFFSAEDLYNIVKKKDKKIGLATIYRFLSELENSKKLYSYICDRRKIYSKNMKSHCHFTCEETGRIIHFKIDTLDFLKDKVPGKITSLQLEVKGICDKCKEKT